MPNLDLQDTDTAQNTQENLSTIVNLHEDEIALNDGFYWPGLTMTCTNMFLYCAYLSKSSLKIT